MCWISTCERNTQRCSPSPPSPVGPISCISWLWLMFPNRFCSPPSPPRADSSWPLPPPLPGAPGMGGLFRYSFTLRQNSSSLSVFGSWWNKAGLTTPKRSNEWILPCSMNYWVQYSAFSHYCISVFFSDIFSPPLKKMKSIFLSPASRRTVSWIRPWTSAHRHVLSCTGSPSWTHSHRGRWSGPGTGNTQHETFNRASEAKRWGCPAATSLLLWSKHMVTSPKSGFNLSALLVWKMLVCTNQKE